MKKRILSSCESDTDFIKHTHLTKLFKKRGAYVYDAYKIFLNCDISKYVGCLPPELLRLVPKDSVAHITRLMCSELESLVLDYDCDLEKRAQQIYQLDSLGDLFNTKCVLQTYDEKDPYSANNTGTRGWFGVVANVYKISFPEINANYALKIFKSYECIRGHGVQHEIPTAFCANKCEPNKNAPIYLGVLFGGQCMLCKWIDSKSKPESIDIFADDTSIYQTTYQESRPDNFKNGKRIDFGGTYKTKYGCLSYRARKLFRKFYNMTPTEIENACNKTMNNFEKYEFQKAYELYCNLSQLIH